MADASLAAERALLPAGLVMGIDEVGRGALAGPVMIGIVIVAVEQADIAGLRDSKALSPKRRERLVPQIRTWSHAWAVGAAGNDVIDEHGIMTAMRRAAVNALAEVDVNVDLVIIDGASNWLVGSLPQGIAVHVEPKADTRYASVAAASVLAKVQRDAAMVELHDAAPMYGWSSNKGYGSAQHRASIEQHGLSRWHRATWWHPSTGAVPD